MLSWLEQLTGLGDGHGFLAQVDREPIATDLQPIDAGLEGLVAAETAGCQVPDRALRLEHSLAAGIDNLNRCLQGQ